MKGIFGILGHYIHQIECQQFHSLINWRVFREETRNEVEYLCGRLLKYTYVGT